MQDEDYEPYDNISLVEQLEEGGIAQDKAILQLCSNQKSFSFTLSLLRSDHHQEIIKSSLTKSAQKNSDIANKLIYSLGDRDIKINTRVAIIEILGEIKNKDAIELISYNLVHDKDIVFVAACNALATINDVKCIDPLKKIALSDRFRSDLSTKSIIKIDHPKAMKAIKKIAKHPDIFRSITAKEYLYDLKIAKKDKKNQKK